MYALKPVATKGLRVVSVRGPSVRSGTSTRPRDGAPNATTGWNRSVTRSQVKCAPAATCGWNHAFLKNWYCWLTPTLRLENVDSDAR